MTSKHDSGGRGTCYVTAFRFYQWAQAQRSFPMPEQVMARFNCARATAHRWLNAYEEALGVERPRRDRYGQIRVATA